MATAQTLIDRALRLIGALASGESATGNESTDGLTALNDLLASWQTERLYVYAMVDTAFTLSPGDGSYTVGPAGDFALTPRPSKIENCFVRINGIDTPVTLYEKDQWFAIPDKSATGDIPTIAYYEPTLATGTLLVYPVPTQAVSLHIVTWTTVSEFASVGTTVSLPQGYNRALTYALAIELAPEYGKEASPTVVEVAREAKASIKRANNRPMIATTELGQMLNEQFDIYSGVTV
jgi:hypothetical protein